MLFFFLPSFLLRIWQHQFIRQQTPPLSVWEAQQKRVNGHFFICLQVFNGGRSRNEKQRTKNMPIKPNKMNPEIEIGEILLRAYRIVASLADACLAKYLFSSCLPHSRLGEADRPTNRTTPSSLEEDQKDIWPLPLLRYKLMVTRCRIRFRAPTNTVALCIWALWRIEQDLQQDGHFFTPRGSSFVGDLCVRTNDIVIAAFQP